VRSEGTDKRSQGVAACLTAVPAEVEGLPAAVMYV
jgi:hypothetical protein